MCIDIEYKNYSARLDPLLRLAEDGASALSDTLESESDAAAGGGLASSEDPDELPEDPSAAATDAAVNGASVLTNRPFTRGRAFANVFRTLYRTVFLDRRYDNMSVIPCIPTIMKGY